MVKASALTAAALLLLAAVAHKNTLPTGPAEVGGEAAFVWELPEGFPTPRVPPDNPMTAAKIELGRLLFHDRRLSGDRTVACASCHQPGQAYTDGRDRALGIDANVHPRSAMSLTNVAYNATLGWDDPSLTRLEDQALIPLLNTGVHRHTGGRADMGQFRAPTLRNIALTAPYMHDGSIPTLEAVVDHYAAGGRTRAAHPRNPAIDTLMTGFELTPDERRQLVAFLHALTDQSFVDRAQAMSPP